MSDLICRKTMMSCQTPGMCWPHCSRQDPVNAQLRAINFDYELHDHAADDEIARLKAELAAELKRRWDGNEISAREHVEEVKKIKTEYARLAEFANEMMEDKSYWLDRCTRTEVYLR